MKPSSNEIAFIAYHEAGHVVATYYLGWNVGEIYIMSIHGKYAGVSVSLTEHDPRAYVLDISPYQYEFLVNQDKDDLINVLHNRALVLIAGQSAENIYANKPLSSLKDFTHSDRQDIHSDVHKLRVIESQLKNCLNNDLNIQTMITKCNDLIKANWDVVKALAEALLSSSGLGIDQSQIEMLLGNLKNS